MAKQLFITPSRCVNCKNCEMSCSFIHTQEKMKPALSRVRAFTFEGNIHSVVACQQCEEALCQSVCPTEALIRNPETNAIERTDACILCKACTLACPFGNIHFDTSYQEIVKCDLCGGDPTCVKFCPTRALVWAEEPAPDIKQEAEIETRFTIEDSRYSANRCLDCGGCSECHRCVGVCEAEAINLEMRDEEKVLDVGSVIIATGLRLFDPSDKILYGYGRFPNVITAMQMERLLSPTRPYNAVLRPSDGKVPDNIAYILCTGSRDCQVDNPLCSRVCCMYSAKQAQLLMGAVPLADITIYYIDIRAFGKGFEEFYQQAKAMGVYFVKGKVARVDSAENGNLLLHHEDIANTGKMIKAEHDLVVLSVGLESNAEALDLFKGGQLEADEYSYVKEIDEDMNPGRTSIDGVFAVGSASAVMDIPDTILHAGAGVAQAAAYVKRIRT